jgi:hypothetical protein
MRQTEQQKRLNALSRAAGDFLRNHGHGQSRPGGYSVTCSVHGLLMTGVDKGTARQVVYNHHDSGCLLAVVDYDE